MLVFFYAEDVEGRKCFFSSVANANSRHFLSWYILNSIATENQKSFTKFENLEDGWWDTVQSYMMQVWDKNNANILKSMWFCSL